MSIVVTTRPLPPPPDTVTALQFITALAVPPAARPAPHAGLRLTGYITEAEAEVWIARNALPTSTLAAIAELPESSRTAARLGTLGMTTAHRLSPVLAAAMALAQADDAERDQLFRFAATLFPDPVA